MWGLILNLNSNFKTLFLNILPALILGFALLPENVNASLAGTPIQSIEVSCSDSQIRIDAQSFFKKKLESSFSYYQLSSAIKEFYVRWPIYDIQARADSIPGGLIVKLHIEPQVFISRIQIQGIDEIYEDDVMDKLNLSRGSQITPEVLKKAEEAAKGYYILRGFVQAKVQIQIKRLEDPTKGIIEVNVDEGLPCLLSDIKIFLSTSDFSPEKIQGKSGLSKKDRCDGLKISSGVRKIEEYLRSKGRFSAKVDDPKLLYSQEGRFADLVINVSVGPRIQVQFRGNNFAFERNNLLKKAIVLEQERQFNQGWIESTAKDGIRRFYRQKGYPQAKVRVEQDFDPTQNLRTIRFFIQRGPRGRLSKIEFVGNKKISQKKLRNYFFAVAPNRTRQHVFVEDEILLAADGVLSFYQEKGFLKAKVSEPQIQMISNRYAHVLFEIQEGMRSTLSEFQFKGNQVFTNQAIKEIFQMESGDPIDPLAMHRAANELEGQYRSKGYKFAKVSLPKVEEIPEGQVAYEVTIQEGPQVRMGKVSIKGNFHTHQKVILREVQFKEGDLYSPEKIRESRRNLVRLGFFQSVSIESQPFDVVSGQEDVVISVVERKKRSIKFRPGFSTDDGVRGGIELGYANIAGTGRSATASARVNRQIRNADITERKIVLTYLEPRIFNLFDGKFNYIDERSEEQQFDIDRRSVILGIERQLFRRIRTTLQWELEYRDPFNEKTGAVLSPLDEARARFGSIATIIDVDRRDDPLNAIKGTFHRLRFNVYNQSLLSDADFTQIFLRNNFYLPIYKRIRSVLSVRLGFSATYGQTKDDNIVQIPIEKRFRLGGNTSLRGFNRNCIGGLASDVPENCSDEVLQQAPGGNSVFNYMLEFLFPLFDGFDLALFTDGGNAYASNADFDLFDIRTTAGAGIRYNTFFGPLRLDYGIVLDRRTGESFGEIHFAVGQF